MDTLVDAEGEQAVEIQELVSLIKVNIDGVDWNLNIQEATQRVIETPNGDTVVQFEACVWKRLEE